MCNCNGLHILRLNAVAPAEIVAKVVFPDYKFALIHFHSVIYEMRVGVTMDLFCPSL